MSVPGAPRPPARYRRGARRTDLRSPPLPTSLDLALTAASAASSKQARDVIVLDVSEPLVISDYFVICSGNSDRQLEALDREIVDQLRNNEHVRPRQREGSAQSGWILLDYGDVVVHIFSASEREFYHLEDLWSAAPTVVRMQ